MKAKVMKTCNLKMTEAVTSGCAFFLFHSFLSFSDNSKI